MVDKKKVHKKTHKSPKKPTYPRRRPAKTKKGKGTGNGKGQNKKAGAWFGLDKLLGKKPDPVYDPHLKDRAEFIKNISVAIDTRYRVCKDIASKTVKKIFKQAKLSSKNKNVHDFVNDLSNLAKAISTWDDRVSDYAVKLGKTCGNFEVVEYESDLLVTLNQRIKKEKNFQNKLNALGPRRSRSTSTSDAPYYPRTVSPRRSYVRAEKADSIPRRPTVVPNSKTPSSQSEREREIREGRLKAFEWKKQEDEKRAKQERDAKIIASHDAKDKTTETTQSPNVTEKSREETRARDAARAAEKIPTLSSKSKTPETKTETTPPPSSSNTTQSPAEKAREERRALNAAAFEERIAALSSKSKTSDTGTGTGPETRETGTDTGPETRETGTDTGPETRETGTGTGPETKETGTGTRTAFRKSPSPFTSYDSEYNSEITEITDTDDDWTTPSQKREKYRLDRQKDLTSEWEPLTDATPQLRRRVNRRTPKLRRNTDAMEPPRR